MCEATVEIPSQSFALALTTTALPQFINKVSKCRPLIMKPRVAALGASVVITIYPLSNK